MSVKFRVVLLVAFIFAPAMLAIGRNIEGHFYILGPILVFIGASGLSAASASIGIFSFLHSESFTKHAVIPLFAAVPSKIAGSIIGIQFMVLASFMAYYAVNTIKELVSTLAV